MRNYIAVLCFKLIFLIRKFAWWIYPPCSRSVVGFGFDGVKVRVYLGYDLEAPKRYGENFGMYPYQWSDTVIRVNDMIASGVKDE